MNSRIELHTELAKMFVDDIRYQRAKYYYFIGKMQRWNESEEIPDIPPDIPEFAHNSLLESQNYRTNIAFVKSISTNDVSFVCRNIPWTENKIFDKWNHTIDMSDKDFFCVNSEFKVYKCIDNNNGAQSTIMPNHNSLYPQMLSDGYVWKYMYTIPSYKRERFISPSWIPIQTALDESFYNNGAIEKIIITNPGSGYNDTIETTIVIDGTTTGSGAVLEIGSISVSGEIEGVNIISGGTNYVKGAKISITTSTGSNAVIVPVISDGVITDVVISNPGIGYSLTDTVNVTVGGAILLPKVSRLTGSLTDVIIIDGGIGYVSPPVLTVQGTIQEPGAGLYEGNSAAIIDAIENAGSIVRVTISDPGINYPVDVTTSLTVYGDGIGAALTPVVYNGEIIDVIIENGGEGYTDASIIITGAGMDAVLTPAFNQIIEMTDQSVVEQVAIPGAIYAIHITSPGSNYTDSTTITIIGDGTGCSAYPVIENGEIVKIIITSPGSNYTYANVTFNNEFGSGAAGYTILPSHNGHGSNAVTELYGNAVAITSTALNINVFDSNIDQEYRMFGIIKNVRDSYTNAIFNLPFEEVFYTIEFNDTTFLEKDEILILNGVYKFLVVDISGTTVKLQSLSNVDENSLVGQFVVENEPERIYAANSLISSPTFDKYSGNIIYATDTLPFKYTPEQNVSLKTYIKL